MGREKRRPDRNVEAIIKHVVAIDYAEAKLEEVLSKIKTPRKGMKVEEYLKIISELRRAYGEYRKHVNYHCSKAYENIEKLRDTDLGHVVERALATRVMENKALFKKHVLEKEFESRTHFPGFKRGDELWKSGEG